MIDRYWQDWTAFMLSMSSFYCTSSPHQKPDEWKTTDPKKVEWPVMTRSGMVSGSGISIAQGLEELRRSEELSGLISGPFESMRHLTSKTSSFTSSNNQRLLVLRCFQAMYVIHPRRCLKFIFSLMLHVKHKARTGTTTGSFEASMSCSVSQNLMTCCSCTKDVSSVRHQTHLAKPAPGCQTIWSWEISCRCSAFPHIDLPWLSSLTGTSRIWLPFLSTRAKKESTRFPSVTVTRPSLPSSHLPKKDVSTTAPTTHIIFNITLG